MTQPTPGDSPRIRFGRIAAAWAAVAGFFILQNIAAALAQGRDIGWQWDVLHELLYVAVWAAFTPIILAHARRHWLEPGARPRVWMAHAGFALVLAPAQILTTYTLHCLSLIALGLLPPADWSVFFHRVGGSMVVLSFTGFFYYWVVLGLFYAIAYRQLYLAKHAEAVRAQLDTLRAQLQPHFLFNALNSISALIADDPALANLMVVRLGDLLRNVLRHRDRHEIPLEEELELLEDYLDIQRIRFADRLEVRLDVSPVTARAMVPTMILQPLVENSIRHGIEPWVDGGIIRIGARRDGDRLVLEIADDGTRAESAGGNGVGLANTRGRMDRLYGGRYELITDAAPDGFTVTLAFPWREDAEE